MASTTYDVNLRYNVRERGMANLERSAHRAAKSTSALDAGMRRLMAAGGAYIGFQKAKSWLIDYNAELQQAKIAMSGLLQLNMGGEFAENQERANKLVRQFQDDAKKSVATTQDFVMFAQMITGPLTRAGASMEQLRDLTKAGVVASRAMGIEAGMAALDIEQAVSGTLKARDRFARAIIEPYLKAQGVTSDFTTRWNEFVRKNPAGAVKELVAALNQPAVKNMAEAQAKSWAGMTSTLKDNLQRALGAVGLPLMQAMTAEMEKANRWFETHPERVKEIAKSVSETLVSAFQTTKRIMAFIVDHRTLLMTLAKAYLYGKVAGALSRGIMSPIESAAGFFSSFGQEAQTGTAKLAKFTRGLGLAAAGLTAVYVGAQAIADHVLAKQEKRIQRQTETSFTVQHAQALAGMQGREQDRIRRLAEARAAKRGTMGMGIKGLRYGMDVEMAKDVLTSARGAGIITGKVGEGKIDVAKLLQRYGSGAIELRRFKTAEEMRQHVATYKGGMKGGTQVERWAINAMEGIERALVLDRELKRRQDELNWQKFIKAFEASISDEGLWGALFTSWGIVPQGAGDKPKAKNWNATVNATVNIKNIVSDDPDRFAMDLMAVMENVTRSGVQARRTLREGQS